MKCQFHLGSLIVSRLLVLVLVIALLGTLSGVDGSVARAAVLSSTIGFGDTVSGSIDVPGESDTYTFSASGGDVILIGSGRTSGNVWPKVRLYEPGGSLLASDHGSVYVEVPATLPGGGVYTILVSDGFNGTYTGGYNLYLQRLNGPAAAHPASYGETASGTVDVPVEMEAYTFSASGGDVILIGSSRDPAYRVYLPLILGSPASAGAAETGLRGGECVSGNLWPKIRLYDPDGGLVAAEHSSVHAEITHSLPVAGIYTILVSDGFNGTYTGDYTLYVQRLNDPGNAVHLSYGQMSSGAVVLPGEMDTYTFDAGAGDVVQAGVSRASGNLWPKIRLYDPDGGLLQTEYGPTHAELSATLLSAGTYVILVSDGFNGTYTGSYEVGVQKIP